MWILVKCKDPIHGPGHNEERRIIFFEDSAPVSKTTRTTHQTTGLIESPFNGTLHLTEGMEVHPHTPGEDGYHCPICHKDIPPATTGTQDEETIKKATHELRKEFEYMATRKMFNMRRNKIGEYLTPDTFCLWAGYWECAVKLGIIPDKIEYVNEGAGNPLPSKLQGRGCGEIIIDDDISTPPDQTPKKKKKKTSDYTGCGTYEP